MTWCSNELRARGVSADRIDLRLFRRRLKVTIPEAAAMANISARTWERFELGETRTLHYRTRSAIEGVLQRWKGKRA